MASYTTVDGVQMLVLPAQHPATLARRGKAPSPPNPEKTIQQVYAPGFTHVINVRQSLVSHIPSASLNVTRLVLCTNYDPAEPATSCKMGSRCKFVHADARGAKQHEIHVNYAWRCVEDVEYERFAPGKVLEVVAPNGKSIGDVMDSQMALKTKALTSKRRPLSHCAHYYFNRTCHLGADCQFIHAVFIDPNAKDHARAPVPAQLGRQQQQNPGTGMRARAVALPAPRGKRVGNGQNDTPKRTTPRSASAAAVESVPNDSALIDLHHGDAPRAVGGEALSDRSTPMHDAMRETSSDHHSSRTATPTHGAMPACVLSASGLSCPSGTMTPELGSPQPSVARLVPPPRVLRVRHDPYSFVGAMVPVLEC